MIQSVFLFLWLDHKSLKKSKINKQNAKDDEESFDERMMRKMQHPASQKQIFTNVFFHISKHFYLQIHRLKHSFLQKQFKKRLPCFRINIFSETIFLFLKQNDTLYTHTTSHVLIIRPMP